MSIIAISRPIKLLCGGETIWIRLIPGHTGHLEGIGSRVIKSVDTLEERYSLDYFHELLKIWK